MASGSGHHSRWWAKICMYFSPARVKAKLKRFSKRKKTAGDLSSDAKGYIDLLSEELTPLRDHGNTPYRDHRSWRLRSATSINSLVKSAMSEMIEDYDAPIDDSHPVHKLAMAVMNKPKEAKSAVEALEDYLEMRQDTIKQLQSLRVLENLFTICGEDSKFREALALRCGKKFASIVKTKSQDQVRNKFLILLDIWQEASKGGDGRFPQFFKTCNDLKSAGIKFPARADVMGPQFEPVADNPGPTIQKSPTDPYSKMLGEISEALLPNDHKTSVSKKRAQPFCKLYTAPPKDYLEFAVKSLEDAKTNASRFCIYEHQCLHILDALIKVGRDAIAEFSLEDKASLCHRICKKNCVAILTEVKKLIDECCDVPNYGWLQAVVVLGDVTEHLWFLLKNFEFYTTLLMKNSHRRESLADQYMDETGSFGEPDSCMITKAEFDQVALLGKAEDLLQSVNSSVQESELATYLVGRLGGKSQLLRVDYKELKRLPGQLGGGASAKVYKTSWLEKTFAEKVFQVGSQHDFEHEMSSLERLSHPNVVLMHCYATSERECSLILELMEMDLSGYMFLKRSYPSTSVQGTSPFNLHEALDIMIQVAEGMCYLRRKNIVHRDLKPKNILVSKVKSESVDEDQEGVRVKISDLGLSVVKELSTTYHITMNSGTSVWMAPELIEFNNHNEDRVRSPDSANSLKYPYACDVYSFGMVCYEVLTGQEPFSSHVGQRVALRHKIKDEHLRPVIPEGYPKALTSLIQNCWNSVPTERPRIEGICKELKSQMCLHVTGQLNIGD